MVMCFSARASFLASALLLPIGAATLQLARSTRQPDKLLLAAAPLGFGLQQGCEGLIWLGLEGQVAGVAPTPGVLTPLEAATLTYLFFAYAFWPVWMAFAAAALVPAHTWRGRLARALPALGLVPGLLLWLPLLGDPGSALPRKIGSSLVYPLSPLVEHLLHPLVGPTLYATLIVLPLLLVPSPRVRVFALTLLVSFGLTEWTNRQALTSLWCFTSALLSAQILWIVAQPSPPETPTPPSLPALAGPSR
jgi:hypothetical protein